MNKREYAQTNKEWLTAKAQEEGVKPLPKGIYYKVLAEGKGITLRTNITTNSIDDNEQISELIISLMLFSIYH